MIYPTVKNIKVKCNTIQNAENELTPNVNHHLRRQSNAISKSPDGSQAINRTGRAAKRFHKFSTYSKKIRGGRPVWSSREGRASRVWKYDGIYEPSTRPPRKISNLDIYPLAHASRCFAQSKTFLREPNESSLFRTKEKKASFWRLSRVALFVADKFQTAVERTSKAWRCTTNAHFMLMFPRLSVPESYVVGHRTEAALMASCRRGRSWRISCPTV